MSEEMRFEDRVAIVTGAGQGLGRSHALLLASRGAKVVVNDLGGAMTGGGSSEKVADQVVAEIEEAGGEAVANYDSVEEGARLVECALDHFGRVDIVVNNAGILRDTSFHKMDEDDWELVYRVHLLGSFRVTHAAWPHMREQRYGRVVMTTSAAGLYGNFGQANYAAAKMGLVGLANTLAVEGQRRNILVNTIAPIAGSRLTKTVLPDELLDALDPEYVSPLVAKLVHEDHEETGRIYEVGGGFYARVRLERNAGELVRLGREVTPELLERNWEAIDSFEVGESTHPKAVMESMQPIMANVEAGPSKGGNEFVDVDAALGYEFPPMHSSYDRRDVALYALGVGAASDPLEDDDELRYVYEMHDEGMQPLPTYGVVPAINAYMELMRSGEQAPGLNYGLDRILHGEQYTELLGPLPAEAELTHRARIKDIYDKGKGALVITEVRSFDAHGRERVRNEISIFVRGAGGWGGERGPQGEANEPPEREPDAVVEEKIPENQALLYRLSGDWNPLHVDPNFAKAVGYDRPILHGLCTFGYAGRHVVERFAPDGDPGYFKSIRVRFAESVYPGETLVTEMWEEGAEVVFRCRVRERDEVVLSRAAVEFYDEVPELAPVEEEGAGAGVEVSREPTSADIFRAIGHHIERHPELTGRIGTVYRFVLTDPSSVWTLDLASERGSVTRGEQAKPECTLEIADADFMKMVAGEVDPMSLFSSGKLAISGDVMASQKLEFLQDIDPALVEEAVSERIGSHAADGDSSTGGASAQEPTSWDYFMAIRDHIGRHPELGERIDDIFLFRLTDPPSAWTLDFSADVPVVEEGDVAQPDCTLALREDDFLKMVRGESDPMKLFSTGKLEISGDVMASQKLEFLQEMEAEAVEAAIARARAEHGGPSASSASAPAPREPVAEAAFAALEAYLDEHPAAAEELGARVQFTLDEPASSWVVDATSSPASIARGKAEEPDVVLHLSDEGLEELARGRTDARDMFQRGRMRVEGDLRVAHRLGALRGVLADDEE